MKRFCILISIILCINLTACSNSTYNSRKTEASNNNILTIATFVNSNNVYLEKVAQRFQELNPDIKVEIKVYGKEIVNEVKLADGGIYTTIEISNQEIEKYRSIINTELISGIAPDIIDIDELAYKKYIDSGMFVNMSKLMKEDTSFDINNYNTKIFEALKYKDGLYTIPLSYFIYLITGNYNLEIDDSYWNWQDFFSSAQEVLSNEEKNINAEYILSVTDKKLFEKMFQSEYENFVNEEDNTANFTSKEFINTIKYCKYLADNNIIYKTSEDLYRCTHKFELSYIDSVWLMAFEGTDSYAIDNATRYYYKMPSNTISSGAIFNSFNMYAINSNSSNEKLAWEFLKFLLNDEMQSLPELYNFPVNNISFNKKIEEDSNMYIDYVKCSNEIEIPLEKANEILKNYTEQIKEFTLNITTWKNQNPEIYSIVDNCVDMYFSGEKTAEEIAQIIQDKVSIYLNEQS